MTPSVIEIADAALGAHLGSGMFRDTYEYQPDPNYVVKRGVATDNLSEFTTWRDVQGIPALASLFAPVAGISSDHRRLLMRRAIVLRSLPKETYDALHAAQARDVMSALGFPDGHMGNFGVIDGRLVMIDYATRREWVDFRLSDRVREYVDTRPTLTDITDPQRCECDTCTIQREREAREREQERIARANCQCYACRVRRGEARVDVKPLADKRAADKRAAQVEAMRELLDFQKAKLAAQIEPRVVRILSDGPPLRAKAALTMVRQRVPAHARFIERDLRAPKRKG